MQLKILLAEAKRYGVILLFATALILLGWHYGVRAISGPAVSVALVTQRDLIQSVVASGHVETPHRFSVAAEIVGTVQRVPVVEGQFVRSGQHLVELRNEEWQAAAAQALAAVEQAQARIRQLREVQEPVSRQNVRQAEVNLDNLRAQLRRSADLANRGFIGQATLDEARKSAELGEAQLQAAQKQLEGVQPAGGDYAVAATGLAQALAGAKLAQSRLAHATVIAPVDGTLIDRTVEPGDVVQPGKTLMVLSPAGETQLIVQVDERNLRLLAAGQRARVSADAYPEQRFTAELIHINPSIDVQRGSIEVKLRVAEPPGFLRQNMTVSVDIEVAARPQAIVVPVDTVRDPDGGQPWVLKVDGRHAKRVSVRLGIRSGGWSEILDGLQAGDQVIPAAEGDIREGSRLRSAIKRRAA